MITGNQVLRKDNLNGSKRMKDFTKEQMAKQIEELKSENHLLSQANQDLRQFAYQVTHDLKEPLRNVNQFSQIFLREFKEDLGPLQVEYLGYISNGIARMNALITGLMNYNALVDKSLEIEHVDLQEVVEEIEFVNLKSQFERTNASLDVPEMPGINGSKTQLVQLFQNFISNSLKFNESKSPWVKIRFTEVENGFQFSICDNGIGMSKSASKKAFDIFTRLHSDKYEGTGLGLASCKRIIELHGGEVGVESTPGKGTCFIFTLFNRR